MPLIIGDGVRNVFRWKAVVKWIVAWIVIDNVIHDDRTFADNVDDDAEVVEIHIDCHGLPHRRR